MKISVIGQGNVGTHLASALKAAGHEVFRVNARTLEGLPEKCDVALIAVRDDAVAEVASRINGHAKVAAHTSGSVPLEAIAGAAESIGVFYPLQTFTKGKPLDISSVPFFIEGSDEATGIMLYELACSISGNVHYAGSALRKRLHIAAVFACNFTNHLMVVADELLKENGLDFSVLHPLVKETVAKLDNLSPFEAQTGPAVRGDNNISGAHEDMLVSHPEWRELYRLLTKDIQRKHKI